MLLTNWLKTLTSRLHKRPAFRSRDRRALRRHWQTFCKNQISTVEVLEDRTLLSATLIDSTLSSVPSNVSLYGNAYHTGGVIYLTQAYGGQNGSMVVDNHGARALSFYADFYMIINGSTTSLPGDGISFVYGDVPNGSWGNSGPVSWDGQAGPTRNGLVIKYDTYNGNTNKNDAGSIEVWYNKGKVAGWYNLDVSNYQSTFHKYTLRDHTAASVSVSSNGQLTLTHRAIGTKTVSLNGWNPQSNWRFGFGASTGGANDAHRINDLKIIDNTTLVAPSVSYTGNKDTRVDETLGSFAWNISDNNGDLKDTRITLQKETSPGVWGNVRSYVWGLTSIDDGRTVNRSLPMTASDIANQGLGNYRAIIDVNDMSGRLTSDISPEMTIVDDDPNGPLINLHDHRGQPLDETETVLSHGGNPVIQWSVDDYQIIEGDPVDSGISSVQVVITKDGQNFATSSEITGAVDLTGAGPGLYEISVVAYDNDRDHGASSTTDLAMSTALGVLRLTNDLPVFQVGLDRSTNENEEETYRVLSSSDADGDTLQFTWDFGDGTAVVQGDVVNHVYKDNGIYDVTVTAVDGFGGTTLQNFTVTVSNVAPVIDGITLLPTDPAVDENVVLTVNASDAASDQLLYGVDWERDGNFDEENQTGIFTRSFATAGLKIAWIRVTDDDGSSTMTEAVIPVGALSPVLPEVNFNTTGQSVNESGGLVVVTASIPEAISADIAVPISIGGTGDMNDYITSSRYFIIPAGETSGQYEFQLIDDIVDESLENLILTMGTPLNAVLGSTATHTVAVVDNDPTPTVWFTSSGKSLNETGRVVTLTARASHPSSETIQIPVALTGTATSGDDYELPQAALITIDPGETFGYFDITLIDDMLPEMAETVIVSMQSPIAAQLSGEPSVTTDYTLLIAENDAPSISFDTFYAEVNEAAGEIVLTAQLSAPHFKEVTATIGLSGTVDSADISPTAQTTLHFAVGETTASATISLTDDNLPEGQEFLVSEIISATGDVLIGARSSKITAINDNDIPKVQFAVASQTYFESNRRVPIELTVTPRSPEAIIVPIIVTAGSASAGSDYEFLVQEVLIPANTSSVTMYLDILEDLIPENNESINLKIGELQDSTGAASIGEVGYLSRHSVIIKNDDVTATLRADRYRVTESNTTVNLAVSLSGPTDEPVHLRISGRGTASNGSDYQFSGPSSRYVDLTIPPGQTSATAALEILDDNRLELDQQIILILSGTGVSDWRTPASPITITDNDQISVSFGPGDTRVDEGVGQVSIPIYLSAPAEIDTFVFVQDPRKSSPDLVTIPAYRTKVDYVASTEDNGNLDVTKHVFFTLSTPVGASLGSKTQHELVIYDDDRRGGFLGDLEYSNFINGRSLDAYFESAQKGFDEWAYYTRVLFGAAITDHMSIESLVSAITATYHFSDNISSETGEVFKSFYEDLIKPLGDALPTSDEIVGFHNSITAVGIDGPITGSQAFFDANKNGILDFMDMDGDGFQDADELSEPLFTTTPGGTIFGTVPMDFDRNLNGRIDTDDGQIALAGGTDLSTNQELTIPLTSPWGSSAVTPLTTLTSELVNQHDYDPATAATRILDGFGLNEFDILHLDPIRRAEAGDVAAAEIFTQGVVVHSTTTQMARFLSGLPNAPSERMVGQVVYGAIADSLHVTGSTLDLGNQFVVQALLDAVASEFGMTIDANTTLGVGQIIAGSNQAFLVLAVDASLEYVEEIARIQVVSQGVIADWLHSAATGVLTINEVLLNSTGENFLALVDSAHAGNLILPEIDISDATISEGDSGQQFMDFTVSVTHSGNDAISVKYTTVDLNDAAGGIDFEPVEGVLTWEAGDASSRTISVPIYGDTEFEGQELFELWLSDAAGAVISQVSGQGLIIDDDQFSYRAPSDGQANTIRIDFYDQNRVVLMRNGEIIHNTIVDIGQPINIYGATDVENEFIVSELAANPAVPGLINITGGGLSDSLVIVNDSAVQIRNEINSESSGVFTIDGNSIHYADIETVRDTWTPALTGDEGPLLEESPVLLGLDFSEVQSRELTTFDWTVESEETPITISPNSTVEFTPDDNGSYSVSLMLSVPEGPEIEIIKSLLIEDVRPRLVLNDITGPGSEGQPATLDDLVTISGNWNDPGLLDQHTIVIDWGEISDNATNAGDDQELLNVGGGSGNFTATHRYSSGGSFTITVSITDDETGFSFTETLTALVAGVHYETVSLRMVISPTAADTNGEVQSLPAGQNWIAEWDSYWIELWVTTADLSSQGVASVSLDLAYQTDLTSATGIEYGAAFTQNQAGTIHDENGLVEGLSATTDLTDLGINTQLLFARIRFESLAEDEVLLDLEGKRIGPHDLGFQIQNSEVVLGSERVSQAQNQDVSAVSIWANPYDLNDDGQISFRDLLLFASVYNSVVVESSSEYAWMSDFNRNGRVAFRDLVLLATNYNKSRLQQQEVIYPNNYPQDWDQQLQVSSVVDTPHSTKVLTQDQAENALQSAVEDVRPTLSEEGQQKLAQVQVEVVDLSGSKLGSVEGNTIYLDVNAAGYGWFVDQTPQDHSEFYSDSQLSLIALPDSEAAGLIDLWTVIRHELGHLLGYEHQEEGLMEAVLDPGERKLADWSEQTDDFFVSLEDDTELLAF